MDHYVIRGKVKGYRSGAGVDSAKIIVFLDHPKTGPAEFTGTAKYPDWVVSESDGSFEDEAYFDSNKLSWFRLHDCTARPKNVVVFITAEHYFSQRKSYAWKGGKLRISERRGEPYLTTTVVEIPEARLVDSRRAAEPHPPCDDAAEEDSYQSGDCL